MPRSLEREASHSFLLSPRTASYIDALIREGDKFDFQVATEGQRGRSSGEAGSNEIYFRGSGRSGNRREATLGVSILTHTVLDFAMEYSRLGLAVLPLHYRHFGDEVPPVMRAHLPGQMVPVGVLSSQGSLSQSPVCDAC